MKLSLKVFILCAWLLIGNVVQAYAGFVSLEDARNVAESWLNVSDSSMNKGLGRTINILAPRNWTTP